MHAYQTTIGKHLTLPDLLKQLTNPNSYKTITLTLIILQLQVVKAVNFKIVLMRNRKSNHPN